MRPPSLYEYFASKHAIYDAMFAQGYAHFRERIVRAGDVGVREMAHGAMEFMVEEPARFLLLFQRTIPGFAPSPESYALSTEVLDLARQRFAAMGITDPRALDLFTALVSGLASQQIANDPDGDRWARLVDDAVDMFLDHIEARPRHARERKSR